jgi:hypothetical protein
LPEVRATLEERRRAAHAALDEAETVMDDELVSL